MHIDIFKSIILSCFFTLVFLTIFSAQQAFNENGDQEANVSLSRKF